MHAHAHVYLLKLAVPLHPLLNAGAPKTVRGLQRHSFSSLSFCALSALAASMALRRSCSSPRAQEDPAWSGGNMLVCWSGGVLHRVRHTTCDACWLLLVLRHTHQPGNLHQTRLTEEMHVQLQQCRRSHADPGGEGHRADRARGRGQVRQRGRL